MRTLPIPPRPGEKVSATLIREIIRAIGERTPIAGHGVKVSIGPNGSVISSDAVAKAVAATSALRPFAVRYVEQGDGIPYTGWEIYLPLGCVTVNSTCTPLNPKATRTVEDDEGNQTTTELGGWYRMKSPSLAGASYPVLRRVNVHVKCNAAHYGVDEIDNWPRSYFWASIDEATYMHAGDTINANVGSIRFTSADEREITQTVDTPIVTTAATNRRFELVHAFEVDGNNLTLTLRKLCVRNPSFAAAGRTFSMEDLTEIDADKEYVYLKLDTQNGVAELKTYSDEDGETAEDQILEETGDFDIFVRLYEMEDGMVVNDDRDNLNNVQVYK